VCGGPSGPTGEKPARSSGGHKGRMVPPGPAQGPHTGLSGGRICVDGARTQTIPPFLLARSGAGDGGTIRGATFLRSGSSVRAKPQHGRVPDFGPFSGPGTHPDGSEGGVEVKRLLVGGLARGVSLLGLGKPFLLDCQTPVADSRSGKSRPCCGAGGNVGPGPGLAVFLWGWGGQLVARGHVGKRGGRGGRGWGNGEKRGGRRGGGRSAPLLG